MQKTPTYLGIFCEDPKNAAKRVRDFCRECISHLAENHKEDLHEQVYHDRGSLDQNFGFPKDNHHITNLFIGGNPDKLNKQQK